MGANEGTVVEEPLSPEADAVQKTEQALNEKIAGVQRHLESSLASLDSKLDKLLAG